MEKTLFMHMYGRINFGKEKGKGKPKQTTGTPKLLYKRCLEKLSFLVWVKINILTYFVAFLFGGIVFGVMGHLEGEYTVLEALLIGGISAILFIVACEITTLLYVILGSLLITETAVYHDRIISYLPLKGFEVTEILFQIFAYLGFIVHLALIGAFLYWGINRIYYLRRKK